MKSIDIKEYEIGNHCFGEILRVNGKDYEELTREEVLEFIQDMMTNDRNSAAIVREVFAVLLKYLQFDMVKNTNDTCDQCGNWNDYSKFINPDEDE